MTLPMFDAAAELARIRADRKSNSPHPAKPANPAKVGPNVSSFSSFSSLPPVENRADEQTAGPAKPANPAKVDGLALPQQADADTFDERAAIAQMDGGLTRDQAEDQAARDQGCDTAAELRFAVVAQWLRRVNAWGATHAGDPFRQRLLTDARAFCGSEWAIQALQLGWGELDIFAVHGVAPEERFDGRGLVAGLDGREIKMMTRDTASILCPAGHCLTHYRRPFDRQRGAVLLWELGA